MSDRSDFSRMIGVGLLYSGALWTIGALILNSETHYLAPARPILSKLADYLPDVF